MVATLNVEPMNKREAQRSTAKPASGPSHDEIAARAESLWRQKGCPEGQSTEIWLEAEQQLRQNAPGKRGLNYDSASEDQGLPLDKVTEELDDRFPDDTGREPTSL
jgi:hypothetical protein